MKGMDAQCLPAPIYTHEMHVTGTLYEKHEFDHQMQKLFSEIDRALHNAMLEGKTHFRISYSNVADSENNILREKGSVKVWAYR